MSSNRLHPIGGEFVDRDQEALFQADRLPETIRHVRLILIFSVIMNSLFLFSDARFYGTSHFLPAIGARLMVIVASFVAVWAIRTRKNFPSLQRVMVIWQAISAIGVGYLCTTRSNIALFVLLMLPALYMLAVPTSFRWTVLSGAFCTFALLCGYLLPTPIPDTALGVVMSTCMSNAPILLFVMRWNRLRRLEWTAARAAGRANAELAESRKLYETMFRAVPVPIVVSRQSDGQFVSINDAGMKFFRIPDGGSIARYNTREMVPLAERRRLQGILDTHGSARDQEIAITVQDGSRRDILLSIEAVQADGVPCTVSSLVDITSRKAMEERIRIAANHDVLTGLANRALFQASLDEALAQARDGDAVGLILIDLDAFKEVNDTLGHDAGDILLKEVGRRLSEVIEPDDLVARLGGDEFVVIARSPSGPEGKDRDLVALSERILATLRPPIAIRGRIVAPRGSLGIAAYPAHADNAADLFTNADLALYAAKAAGRNRANVFEPGLRAVIEDRVTVTREMRSALQTGELFPHYQPKVDLATGQIMGFEALARWQHPSRGLLMPSDFATVFDDPEIGIEVGQTLRRQIFADVARWIELDLHPGRVFLNLSSAQFAQNDLASVLLADIAFVGLTCDRIGIEVTETVLLAGNGNRVGPILDALHAAGIRIALDDFGTGYASLTHLKQFPVDEIKIDRSFVQDLERDPDDAAIVAAVLQLGQSLGLDVTAEGVETEAQARFLLMKGCGLAQGYLYGKPVRGECVPHLLERFEAGDVLAFG
ncbi:putative bifunctional diguanylate cyclase/phosphodiesterase [Methylobacterium gossipiicola]|uniref:PAS domain S-box-containing protein/diguanylate cyclase (GGDEF) domain-containing protein n=1 Tax=Methylobacterium gossipiicola TaxID=582675 RepID=A0A1I2QW41_9HYPH|nr:EAL domain-containing protein [Methylobacterium gossipiicola]SFG29871.1 PAS domain S-box-containing protein/diguanylate cyclase (GGDEF) domain-containing protein [Methylobacterium gossipiicola]